MFNSGNGYSLADIAAATGGAARTGNGGAFGDDGGAWWIIILFLFTFMGWGNNGNGWGNGNGGGGALTRSELGQDLGFGEMAAGIRGITNGLSDGFYAMNTGMLNGFGNVDTAICGLGQTVQQGFNNTNVALLQGQNALGTQLADCCCTTKNMIQQASYDNAIGLNGVTRQIADTGCEIGRAIEGGFADVSYKMAANQNATQVAIANSTRDIIDNANENARHLMDYLCQEKISSLQAENQTLRLAASQQEQNNYLISQLQTKAPVPAYTVPNPYAAYGLTSNLCGCGAI